MLSVPQYINAHKLFSYNQEQELESLLIYLNLVIDAVPSCCLSRIITLFYVLTK
jgi:hypothetical protein